jgi:hypothetical protein
MEISILDLPDDSINDIIGFLNNVSIVSVAFVCKLFNRKINLKNYVSANIYMHAAACGNVFVLQLLWENNYKWNEYACVHAATYGHLEVFKWARKNGCIWNVFTSRYAAEFGHLELLKWAIKKGSVLSTSICTQAARNGHLKILKWAIKNNCPYNRFLMINYKLTDEVRDYVSKLP